MILSVSLRGLLSLVGAFSISLGVGIMYLWGIITIYGTSYFRIVTNDSKLTQSYTDLVFPLTLLGQAISMPLAARFAKKISTRFTCFVAGIVMASLMYMASYTQSFGTFCLIFGLGNGMVIGIIYILPISHCFQFFPNRKSSISMIIISASGIGTLIYSMMAINIINIENKTLEEQGTNLFYNKQISQNFPIYLRVLSAFILGFVSGGSLLLLDFPTNLDLSQKSVKQQKKEQNLSTLMNMQFALHHEQSKKETHKNPFGTGNYQMGIMGKNFDKYNPGKVYGEKEDYEFWDKINQSDRSSYVPPNQINDNIQEESQPKGKEEVIVNQCPRTSDGPKEAIFWWVFLVITLGTNFGLMISVNYKTFVKAQIMDDRFLNLVGGVGAIACGFSRFIWGSMLQTRTFKFLLNTLLIINAFLAFSIFYIYQSKEIYFIYVVLAYICYGGHLGMFPAITSQIFGTRYGPQIYGILFYAFPASNFIQFFIVNYIDQGYWMIFTASGIMSICALVLTKKIELKYDWSVRIRDHNQRQRHLRR